jgi:ABC-type cobalamin/Fe3+-siderophores transport system ATPase subunit
MKIELHDIKKIKRMDFHIPKQGVWLITGLNGSGKTSLLAALYRIGSSHAFQRYYKSSSFQRMDSFENTQIKYFIGGDHVTYRYGGQRWRASPSRNSIILNKFPFPTVYFIEANGARVEPFADEIKPRSVRSVSQYIQDFMTYVLDNEKWRNLKYVNTRRGVGSEAFLIPYQSHGNDYYYSEKNFSLGELCVLRLAYKLSNIDDKSLILIDEIEMALHPQAQVRLLEKIQEISRDKKLTILFSTHSATLIKNIGRKNIIFLKEVSRGRFESISSVYPAQVLGEIAFDDELNADFIFYVEDKQAKALLEQLIALYFNICTQNLNYAPLYKIVPVGGFPHVVNMLNSSNGIFPKFVKRHAVLDADVKTDALEEAKRTDNRKLLDLFNASSNNISYLPCTPEQGLMELIELGEDALIDKINNSFQGTRLNIKRIISGQNYKVLNKSNIREKAKDRIHYIVNQISESTGQNKETIYKILYGVYCVNKYSDSKSELHQMFGPIFNAR